MSETLNEQLGDATAVDTGEATADASEAAVDAAAAVDTGEAAAGAGEAAVAAVDTSLYGQLGGEAAVDAAVNIFYRKILADDTINKFFDGTDMEKQLAKQKAFLTMAFGGPNNYTGKDLTDAHAPLVARGMNDSHVSAVLNHLQKALQELKVSGYLVVEVMKIAESTRNAVLGR